MLILVDALTNGSLL